MAVVVGQGERLGQLVRTSRAFRHEAMSAMRRDVVRALVEYITNADDAYATIGGKGRILITVDPRREGGVWTARVADRASGMLLRDLIGRLGRQGGRTSGFEAGVDVRGNLGLGAKDPAAFGKVTFETIRDNEYSWLSIDDRGDVEHIKRSMRVTKELRDRLGVPKNGTVVTLEVKPPVRCPRHDTLKTMLRDHVQLRDIVQADDREVFLQRGSERPERINYEPARARLVATKTIPIRGYPEAKADLTVYEAEAPFQDLGRRNPYRQSGLLIKGARAVYESSLFAFEGNPAALAFFGAVSCPFVDRIANEYDDKDERRERHPDENPIPIISRQRDGLVEEHPFREALAGSVEQELAPLIAARETRLREQSAAVESERTKKLFAELNRLAAEFLRDAAAEDDLELPPANPPGLSTPQLVLVPSGLELHPGEERTLSVFADKKGLDVGDEVLLSTEPPDVITLFADRIRLAINPRRVDVLSGTVKIRAGLTLGITLIGATLGKRTADCAVEVVTPETPAEPIPPAALEFEHRTYTLAVGKKRTLRLRAPLNEYSEGDALSVTSSDGRAVVVLGGGRTVLVGNQRARALEATVDVEARSDQAKALLTARDSKGRTAQATVSVAKTQSGVDWDTTLVSEAPGDWRAAWSSDFRLLKVYGEHPALKPYLGSASDGYPGQHTELWVVLAMELTCDAVVRRMLQLKYGTSEVDAYGLYTEHNKRLSQLLARARKAMKQ
jgi:hypothetical protein